MKSSIWMLSALLFLSACGTSTKTPPAISVSLTPSAQKNIDVAQTLNIAAAVNNDSSGKGVTWAMAGTNCTGSACGTFTKSTTTGVTYNAPPSVTANMTVTIQATSMADPSKASSVSIVVSPEPTIKTTSMSSGTAGTAYSLTLQASGGAGTLTWSLAAGSTLPAGLTLSSSGTISGTPTAPGTSNFSVKVTDASSGNEGTCSQTLQLSITIKPAALTITTTSLPSGLVGAAYSASLAASGGSGTITWSVTAGSLPAGLTLNASGSISGTPTTALPYSFTVTATDSGTPAQTAQQLLNLFIYNKLVITTTSLPNGLVGKAYSATLQASGGAAIVTWSITSGTLPAGLSLSGATISGTPTTAGSSSFTVTAKDSGTPPQSAQQALTITVTAGLVITTTSLPDGTVNSAYSATLHSTGGTAPVTWSLSQGSLPAGLTLSSAGNISGTPTAAGQSNVTVSATDSSTPTQTQTQALSIMIHPPLAITTTTLPGGTVGTAYSEDIGSSGGTLPITWTVTSGTLPAGLTLQSGANGDAVVSGTPTAAGSSTFTVKASDSSSPVQSASQQLTITINSAPISIVTNTLPNGTENVAYSASLQVSGGTPPYKWTVSAGSTLPSWLSLSSAGALSGTPTATGSFTFSLTVTDSGMPTPQSKSQSFTLTVAAVNAACGTGNESMLHGQYAFSLRGYNNTTSHDFLAVIGSFTADGNGHITAGMVDSNSLGAGVKSGSITASGSSYSVGSDNRGCATIVTPFYTFTIRLSLADTTSGPSSGGAIEEWEPGPSPYIAVGKLLLQKSIPAKLPAGNWVFLQTGIYSTTGYRLGVAGVVTADGNGNLTKGEYDSNVVGHLHTYTGLTGTYTNADPTTGRFSYTSSLSGVTVNRVNYLVSSTQFLELVSDALTGTSEILIGEGQLQSASLTVSGKLVYSAGGVSVSTANANYAQFGLVTITPSSTLAIDIYSDDGGTWSKNTNTYVYAIDSYGRLLITGIAFYLTGPNTGVMLALGSGVLVGQLQPQSATTLTPGTYFFGTVFDVPEYPETTQVGTGTISAGGVTGTIDKTSTGSPQQGGEPIAETFTVNSDGTFSSSDDAGVVVGIIISNSRFVLVGEQKKAYPTMLVVSTTP